MTVARALQIRLLGELEVVDTSRAPAQALPLPPSKKARALLAYLVVTGRPHTRERLCDLLWDVADDPRAALRWCLTKLRPIVDVGRPRLTADRSHVALDLADVSVDALELRTLDAQSLDTIPTADLERMLLQFRGEFLEALDLPDFATFHAWRVAHREELRRLHARLLSVLLGRAGTAPERALPLARAMADLDPQDDAARALFLELLHASGRYREAEEQSRTSRRLFAPRAVSSAAPSPASSAAPSSRRSPGEWPLVARNDELGKIERAVFDERASEARVAVVYGEAGSGKSRVLEEIRRRASDRGLRVARVECPEEQPGWPYAAWADVAAALGSTELAANANVGARDDASVAPGLALVAPADSAERERRFAGLAAAIAAGPSPLLLVIDDAQWLDRESAALVDYLVARAGPRARVVIAARAGALADSLHATRLLRALRRRPSTLEIALTALTRDDAAVLARAVIQTSGRSATPDHVAAIVADAGGNPFFVIELARAPREPGPGLPAPIGRRIRDRVELMPIEHADALRWSAVLGTTFASAILEPLLDLPSDGFVALLERLEQHGWLVPRSSPECRAATTVDYAFAHELVRRAVYDGLSEPRRRLMHRRVATLLGARTDADPGTLAHHAALGGDARTAALACLDASRRFLRLGAIPDAVSLAHRGVGYARTLPEPERTTLLLELHHPSVVTAQGTEREALLAELAELSERALALGAVDHARLGCVSRANLLWHEGESLDVHKLSLEMERVSRLGGARERVLGLGDAAHCLASIESDLALAEAMLLEGEALGRKEDIATCTLPLAGGILRLHRGEYALAGELFERAEDLARRENNRLAEFHALEQRYELAFAGGLPDRADRARDIAQALGGLAGRIREGSERAFARALELLATKMRDPAAQPSLEEVLEELAMTDAKQRTAYVLGRAALLEIAGGQHAAALDHGRRALALAEAIRRPSEAATARAVIVQAAARTGDRTTLDAHRPLLAALDPDSPPLSAFARQAIEAALAATCEDSDSKQPERPRRARNGARDRRTRVR